MPIPKVSLTYLLDFVQKSGSPKATVVSNFKTREEYDPQKDFYKPLREQLVSAAKGLSRPSDLDAWVHGFQDGKKHAAYLDAIAGFRRFVGRKPIVWFDPPRKDYDLGPAGLRITVTVNPELGLVRQGVPYVIKLFLKELESATK